LRIDHDPLLPRPPSLSTATTRTPSRRSSRLNSVLTRILRLLSIALASNRDYEPGRVRATVSLSRPVPAQGPPSPTAMPEEADFEALAGREGTCDTSCALPRVGAYAAGVKNPLVVRVIPPPSSVVQVTSP
jgi:hypothetical protein